MASEKQILELCEEIYSREDAKWLANALMKRLPEWRQTCPTYDKRWDETETYLITYGDQFQRSGEAPLHTLKETLDKLGLQGLITGVHILPFFPYTSDDGFSVVDFEQVDPKLGTWEHIKALHRAGYDLAFDLVLNHVSSENEWLKRYLAGEPEFQDFFIDVDPNTDLSQVTRPRASPLLTQFGDKHLWSTFSADQIDPNFGNPRVMLKMVDIFVEYLNHGAKTVRMDAIAYLWKEIGTNCIHHRKTHAAVKLFRMIMDDVAPGSSLLTETNVPQTENFSYFGDGDEAHMVYQFSLPPLLLYTLLKHNADPLKDWAENLPRLPDDQTFFNFTASHDGIGVRPLEGLVKPEVIQELVNATARQGGLVNYKSNPDGSKSPYELNCTLSSALLEAGVNAQSGHAAFICSQAIAMALQGVPALYVHSLFASANDTEGVQRTKHNRTINRHKFIGDEIDALDTPGTTSQQTLAKIKSLLTARKSQPAFHPNSHQTVLPTSSALFAIQRRPAAGSPVVCVFNVTDKPQLLTVGGVDLARAKNLLTDDLITESTQLPAFGFAWVELSGD